MRSWHYTLPMFQKISGQNHKTLEDLTCVNWTTEVGENRRKCK